MNIYKITVTETDSLVTEVWLFQAATLQGAVQLAEAKRESCFGGFSAIPDEDETTWEITKAESLGTLQNAMKGAKAS